MFEEYHERAAETGIDVTGITLTGGSQTTSDLIAQAIRNFQHIYSSNKLQVVRTSADIQSARQNGKQAIFFNCQGADCLDNKPHLNVPLLRGLGVGTWRRPTTSVASGRRLPGAEGRSRRHHGLRQAGYRRAAQVRHYSRPVALF